MHKNQRSNILCVLHRRSFKWCGIQVAPRVPILSRTRASEVTGTEYLFSLVAWQSAMARSFQYPAPSKIIDA